MAQTGVVKFFNGERGYGFIKPDDGGRDVFVHITAVEQAGLKGLNEGQRISFDSREPEARLRARADYLLFANSVKSWARGTDNCRL
jgi:CspA family cold shock protein